MVDTTKIASLEDIPNNQAKVFEVDGLQIVIARRDNKVWGYKNVCPHLGIGLNSAGDKMTTFDDSYLICTMHGAMFEFETGFCVGGPCASRSLIPVKVEVSENHIYFYPS